MKIITDDLKVGDITMVDAAAEDVSGICVKDLRIATGVLGGHPQERLVDVVNQAMGEEFDSLEEAIGALAANEGIDVPSNVLKAAKMVDKLTDEISNPPEDSQVVILEAETFNGTEHTLVFSHSQAIDIAHTIAEWAEAMHKAGNCNCGDHEDDE